MKGFNSLLSNLVRKLGPYKQRGQEYAFKCPLCRDYKNRMDINFWKQIYHCYNCGAGGFLTRLLVTCLKLDWQPVTALPVPLENLETQLTECKLPEEYISLKYTPQSPALGSFLQSRNIPTTLYYQWGYCPVGKYRDRVIIPVYENGKLVTWIARSYLNEEPKELSGPNRSQYWYGYDDLQTGEASIIVEGIFDCEHLKNLGYTALAAFGAHISQVQIGKLLAKRPRTITLMLDGDLAGRSGTRAAVSNFFKRGVLPQHLRVILLPDDKDPDDLSKEELDPLIKG